MRAQASTVEPIGLDEDQTATLQAIEAEAWMRDLSYLTVLALRV